MTARPNGGVLIACEDGVLRFQSDGSRGVNLPLPQFQGGPILPTAMTFDATTNLWTAGAAYSPNIAVLCKYNQDTSIQWTNTEFALGSANYPGAPRKIFLDAYGNCYAGGFELLRTPPWRLLFSSNPVPTGTVFGIHGVKWMLMDTLLFPNLA